MHLSGPWATAVDVPDPDILTPGISNSVLRDGRLPVPEAKEATAGGAQRATPEPEPVPLPVAESASATAAEVEQAEAEDQEQEPVPRHCHVAPRGR